MQVSVIIVTRNEEIYILNCIKSIETQFEKDDEWELIIVDGMSEDKTKDISSNYLSSVDYDYQILENEKKILSAGWNIGIKNAKGKYVVRPDAHGALHAGYIKYGLEVLEQKSDVTAVGGMLETKAKGFWGGVIKEALSSRVGVGNSSFRIATQSGYYDTAVFALYRKDIFEKVGYFDEKLVRHQDNDMHRRVKEAGGKFYLDICMMADYYCRDTVPKLLKQMFSIGRYLPDVMSDGSLSVRHLAPFIFYMILLILLIFGLINPMFILLNLWIFGGYLFIITLDTITRVIKKKNLSFLLNIFIIPVMHMSYAFGTLVGFITKLKGD